MHLFLISGCRDFRSRSLLQWSENDVCDWLDSLFMPEHKVQLIWLDYLFKGELNLSFCYSE